MSAVYLITQTIFGHFGHFDKIFRSSTVIFADAGSSLKSGVSYIVRFIVNIGSVSRLSLGAFLIYEKLFKKSRKP